VARKVERLTLDNLGSLPGGCSTCSYWECDPVRRAKIRGREAEEKAAWLSEMLREWGSVGRVISLEDDVIGHIQWAPALYLPGSSNFATAPVSGDAVLLASAYIDPVHRNQGLARVLIQSMAKDLIRHGGIGAVEAFGSHRPQEDVCVLPVDFLLAVGFKTHRAHPQHPRMRMDLRTTVTWREELEAAAERLFGVVTGKQSNPAPRPVPRGTARTSRTRLSSGRPPRAPRGAR
jgi:GNAT superfamily N-acetyltransferase